jgi:hypothetical protein
MRSCLAFVPTPGRCPVTDWKELLKQMIRDDPTALAELDKLCLETRASQRGDVAEVCRNTPKDPVVRRLAGLAIKTLRDPAYRALLLRTLPDDAPLSYEEIGQRWGPVSRERIRQMHETLEPEHYTSQKQNRGEDTR